VFLLKDSPCNPNKEEEDLPGFNSCYKSLGAVAAAVVKTEKGPICCYSGLKGGSRKRGSSSMPLLITALVYIRV
jgi:hypothetical protein